MDQDMEWGLKFFNSIRKATLLEFYEPIHNDSNYDHKNCPCSDTNVFKNAFR